MRTQANGVAVPPQSDRPQVTDPDQIGNWRRYAKLHTQLYPYLAAAVDAYRRRGMPPMRQLALAFPGDRRARAVDDQFLLGPDLLAAPVLEQGATERGVYVPRGDWVDLWRSAEYRELTGALRLEEPQMLSGRGTHTLPAPLDELPLLVRAGAVVALLPAGVDTLAGFRAEVPVVRLADRRDRLQLLAFPRGDTRSSFLDGERLRSHEGDERWRLVIDGSRDRHYLLRASLHTLRAPFVPCDVRVDGARLSPRRWSFEHESGVLGARLEGRVLEVEVKGVCR
jgi:hypothetical protein